MSSIEFHGVRAEEQEFTPSTPESTPFTVPVYVGTAPVHLSTYSKGAPVNVPMLLTTWEQAKAYMGYSDDWESFTLSEVMYSHFYKFKTAPFVVINVLDPVTDVAAVPAAAVSFVDGTATLTTSNVVIDDDFTVQSSDGATTYARGTDYTASYNSAGRVVVSFIASGTIPPGTTSLQIGFNVIDPTKVTKAEIIGGYDSVTGKRSGLELVEEVFPRFQYVPGLILAPGHSHDPLVGAVMDLKAASINGVFESTAVKDIPANMRYLEAVEWKTDNEYTSSLSINGYPRFLSDDKLYHASTLIAGATCVTDANNDGIPYESPSNKPIYVDAPAMDDGSEMFLAKDQADYLNAYGIVTGINFTGQYTAWGNHTGAFPILKSPQRSFIPVRRMFTWVKNNVVLFFWSRVDRALNRRLADSIADDCNVWLNGLSGPGYLVGASVSLEAADNPPKDIMNGILRIRLKITPPSPAQEIVFLIEYDQSNLALIAA